MISLAAITGVVIAGAGLDIMEVDAAQYAGMARDMLEQDDPLKLYFRGEDYLDKPPLLFWLSALSFKIFGVHEQSYRLPSILFAALGLFSTFRFAARYHGLALARRATIMLGCSAAFFLMTNDVRCDTMLMGAVITAVWCGCAWVDDRRLGQALGFAFAMAAGALAKGPIGVMAPMLAVGCHVAYTGRWRNLLHPHVILIALGIALCLLPMCIGLYQQHGWHGLRFYFWEQSFGRLTGENRWRDDSTVLYFTHEALWQLLPWTVFLLVGAWGDVRALLARRRLPEFASSGGGILVFIALSLSQFKLPHYLYVVVPLLAVISASGWERCDRRSLASTQWVLVATLGLALLFLVLTVFPERQGPFTVLVLAAGAFAVWSGIRWKGPEGVFGASVSMMVTLGLVMNGYFYPGVLAYQANAKAGQWAMSNGVDHEHFYGMQISGTALDFYAGYPVRWLSHAGEARRAIEPGVTIYTDEGHRAELLAAGLVPLSEDRLWNYPAQRLGLPFLFPAQRAAVLEQRFLLHY